MKKLKDLFFEDYDCKNEVEEIDKDCDCESCEECSEKGAVNEFYFDKFVDSILVSENKGSKLKFVEDSPIRKRIKRHQEKPLNRITIRG